MADDERVLTILRYSTLPDRTVGLVMYGSEHLGYALEDPYRPTKVPGVTRIPSGRYRLSLRQTGAMHQKYRQRFPDSHHGMLWLRHVPGFEYVYIHIGNTPEDTEGCILVGAGVDAHGSLIHSEQAYRVIYGLASRWILDGIDTYCLVGDYAEMMRFAV